MNILIVDENEIVRRQLFWALRKGHDLHEAASREDARQIVPPQFRAEARIVKLDKFTLEKLDAIMTEHGAPGES